MTNLRREALFGWFAWYHYDVHSVPAQLRVCEAIHKKIIQGDFPKQRTPQIQDFPENLPLFLSKIVKK